MNVAEIDERLIVRNQAGKFEGVRYDRMTALLSNAVQELAARETLAQEQLAELRRFRVLREAGGTSDGPMY